MSAVDQHSSSALARNGLSLYFVGTAVAMAAVVTLDFHTTKMIPLIAGCVATPIIAQRLLPWRAQIACIVCTIMFIPIKRYELPVTLPISLEPYRLVVGIVVLCWLSSALIDPRTRIRRTRVVDAPVTLFVLCIAVSLMANPARVASVSGVVVKSLLFFASFVAMVYIVPSLVVRRKDVEFIINTILLSGGVVAAFSLVEERTGFNVFQHLDRWMPLLRAVAAPEEATRDGRLRVFGSAQHPIALGAMLAMLIPLALSRVIETKQRRWWMVLFLLLAGAAASQSRTTIIMFAVSGLVYGFLRPQDVKRLVLPVLIVGLVGIHALLPGTLGTIKASFFPKGGLVAQQSNAPIGSGRLATLGPALRAEFYPHMLVGEGFGTRVTGSDPSSPAPNAPILDDEWAGVLIETGVAGAVSLLALFIIFVGKIGREARRDSSTRGLLLASFAASVAAFGVSMFTYDAFSFIQVTFVLFIFIGLASSIYAWPRPVENMSGAAAQS